MAFFILFNKLIGKTKTQNSFSEDSSSAEDELFIFHQFEKIEHRRIDNYVKNVALQYNPTDFRIHFRITKPSFEHLLQRLLMEKKVYMGRPSLPMLDSLLLTLWALSTQETYREIGDRFGIDKAQAYRIFIGICKLLVTSNIRKEYIRWPENLEAIENLNAFNKLRGDSSFPNVFACVDGTHIAIPGNPDDNSYYNRKGYHSVQVQLICDSQRKIINVNCGWPGSVHDARVWRESEVCKKLQQDRNSLLPPNTYILGDSAYPLANYLMVPFKDNGLLTRRQHIFNTKLSKTRVLIEQVIGQLKGMFRRLKYVNVYKKHLVKYIVVSSCILYNIYVLNKEESEEEFEEEDLEMDDVEEVEEEPVGPMIDRDGIALRNYIMNRMT